MSALTAAGSKAGPRDEHRRRPLIAARGIGVAGRGAPILEKVDIEIAAGEIVTLVGPNGAGKTTLARILLGLDKPDLGVVERADAIVVGYVPQRLGIDAVLPLTVDRFLTLARRADRRTVDAALDEVGARELGRRALHELSGGELQRTLLARALLRKPDLLILDEPVQGVDFSGQFELYELIARIRDERGCGMLLISHDLHLVMAATDRVVCLNRHICCAGHPEDVSRDPAYVALFGPRAARDLAVYHHEHDHRHDLHGGVVPIAADHRHEHDHRHDHDQHDRRRV